LDLFHVEGALALHPLAPSCIQKFSALAKNNTADEELDDHWQQMKNMSKNF
jgi:hypothetical protein